MFYTLNRNSVTIKSRCPVRVFVDCSVCGYSLADPGFCPACGSENQASEIIVSDLEELDIEENASELIEIQKEESGSTSDQSTDFGNISTIKIPFGIDHAPSKNYISKIPYGLDYAPFIREN